MRFNVFSFALVLTFGTTAAPVESRRDADAQPLSGRANSAGIEKDGTYKGQSSQQRADDVKAAFDFAWDGYYK